MADSIGSYKNTEKVSQTTEKPEVEHNIVLYPVEILANIKDINNEENGLF